jgi:hypothetical protein
MNKLPLILNYIIYTLVLTPASSQVYVTIWDAGNNRVGEVFLPNDLDTLSSITLYQELAVNLTENKPYLLGLRRDSTELFLPSKYAWTTRLPKPDSKWHILYDFLEGNTGIMPTKVDTTCGSNKEVSALPDAVWTVVVKESSQVKIRYSKSTKSGLLHGGYFGLREDGCLAIASYHEGLSIGHLEQYWPNGRIKLIQEFDKCGFVVHHVAFRRDGTYESWYDGKLKVGVSFDEDGTLWSLRQRTPNAVLFGVQLILDEKGQILQFDNLGPLNSE